MRAMTVEEMREVEGGIKWACVGAGLLLAGIIANPELIFGLGEQETALVALCLAS